MSGADPQLLPQHLADLRRSGLFDATIERWGCYSIEAGQRWVMLQLGFPHIEPPALALPIIPPDRTQPDPADVVLKPDHPRTDNRGHPCKYEARPKSRNRVHAPLSIRDKLSDPSVPLIITEGSKKAEAGAQAGMCTIALAGVWNWRDRIGEASFPIGDFELITLEGRRVLICFDSDAANNSQVRRAARDLAAFLAKRFRAQVSIKRLPPSPDAAKVGLDDFMLCHTVDDFWKLSEEPVRLEPDTANLIEELTPETGKRDRDRALALIANEADPVESERLLKKLAKQIGARLKDLRNLLKSIGAAQALNKPEPHKLSEAERLEALSLLQDPELLGCFLKDCASMGIVGEQDSCAVLELTFCSRLGEEPANLNVKGESAAGKNHLAGTIARMHPPEGVKEITYASARSLFYLRESLSHKILLIMEAPGAEQAQYSIRTMESEKKLKVLVAERVDGRIETREHTVEGPVAVVQTTTRPHLHPENETRTFDIFIDESEPQTKAILREQALRAERPEMSARAAQVARRWQNAHRLLEPHPVVVPFAGAVAEALGEKSPLSLRVRRDFPRIVALIQASALLYQYQRERECRHGVEYLLANEDDFEIVREIAGPILAQAWVGATPKCRQLVEAVARIIGDETWLGEEGRAVSTKKLIEALHWSAPTVRKYAKEAVNLGCLASGGKGQWLYLKSVAEVSNPLPRPEEVFRE